MPADRNVWPAVCVDESGSIGGLLMRRIAAGFVVVAIFLAGAVPAFAHETDQFTVPPDREFADIGNTITRWAYRAVEAGVDRTNSRIRDAIKGKRDAETIKKL